MAILAARPEKQEVVVRELARKVTKMVDKGLHVHTFVHRLLKEFCAAAPEGTAVETLLPALHDATLALSETVDGAWTTSFCLGYGSAKDRKKMVKGLKGFVTACARHINAHMVVVKFLSTMDDTVLLRKAVISELAANLPDVVTDRYACKVLLHLLAPLSKRYFFADDAAVVALGHGSKKSPEVRRAELLPSLKDPLLAHLSSSAVCARAMRNQWSCDVLCEAIAVWAGEVEGAATVEVEAAVAAAAVEVVSEVADAAAKKAVVAARPEKQPSFGGKGLKDGDDEEGEGEGDEEEGEEGGAGGESKGDDAEEGDEGDEAVCAMHHPCGHRALVRMLRQEETRDAATFANGLAATLLEADATMAQWTETAHSSYVVQALLARTGLAQEDDLKAALGALRPALEKKIKAIRKATKGDKSQQNGFTLLLQRLDGTAAPMGE